MSYISPEIPVMSTFDTSDSFSFPVKILNHLDQEQLQSYKEAFDSFDSNQNGKVSSNHLQVKQFTIKKTLPTCFIKLSFIQRLMRKAGANPTDIEVMEIINKIDNESGSFDFPVSIDFESSCLL